LVVRPAAKGSDFSKHPQRLHGIQSQQGRQVDIINAKVAGPEVIAPAVEAPPRVVNLMDALKKSLDAVATSKKKPAKAQAAGPAAKRKRA
jgi:non-homologous end joining protein Ku